MARVRIGIDVGGTNTDAVVMDGNAVLAWTKCATTRPVGMGIVAALRAVLADSGIDPGDVRAVMIGTTQFVNAFVEARGLLPVAIIRLGSPSGLALPPMAGWPKHLRAQVEGMSFQLPGGCEFDGRPISRFDPLQVRAAARRMRAAGIDAVAISSVFAPVDASMEAQAASIVAEEMPHAKITLSSRIGRIGLLERENATIMNASLGALARDVVHSFHAALSDLRIDAPLYVSQNDGTVMSAAFTEALPILSFGSGPTNSLRGAAFLTGCHDAIVIDIGGTTTDIGVLVNGFPRESSIATNIGGVRTNFRMPDVLSIGLGGGTIVQVPGDGSTHAPRDDSSITLGPRSVGSRLSDEAYVFGGKTLTMTDIAVACGFARIGDAALLPPFARAMAESIAARADQLIEQGIDRMKAARSEVPAVVVGGGGCLLQRTPRGVSRLVRPEHAEVANAIGASIAQVSGELDRIISYASRSRESLLGEIRADVKAIAAAAGALPETIELSELEEVALGYLPGKAVRVRARAVGALDLR